MILPDYPDQLFLSSNPPVIGNKAYNPIVSTRTLVEAGIQAPFHLSPPPLLEFFSDNGYFKVFATPE